MSTTTGQETRSDWNSQTYGPQDTLVRPNDTPTANDPGSRLGSAASYGKERCDPTHNVHNNAHHLLAQSLVRKGTTRSDFDKIPPLSQLVEVTWGASENRAEQRAEQVKWVAPGGWTVDTANSVDSIINIISYYATWRGNEVDGSVVSNLLRDRADEMATAADTVKYLHARAADQTAETLKSDLGYKLMELGAKRHLGAVTASQFSRDYNALTSRGSKDDQARVNGSIGLLYLRESEARSLGHQKREEGTGRTIWED